MLSWIPRATLEANTFANLHLVVNSAKPGTRKHASGRLHSPAALARRAFIKDGIQDASLHLPATSPRSSQSPTTSPTLTSPRTSSSNYQSSGEPGLGDFEHPPSRPVGPLYRQSPKVANDPQNITPSFPEPHFCMDAFVLARAPKISNTHGHKNSSYELQTSLQAQVRTVPELQARRHFR